MEPNLEPIRTLLASPDRPDRDTLFAVLNNERAATILACLAPTGTLTQLAAAMRRGWSWDCKGWDRHADLIEIVTDPRNQTAKWMIYTWSSIPSAVGVLRELTDDLVKWAVERLDLSWYADLAVLLGPSDTTARFLLQSPSILGFGTTFRRWSMATNLGDPTAWHVMVTPDLRDALRQDANPSRAFPAWGWDVIVNSGIVLDEVIEDLFDGWDPDHLSIWGRIAWLEEHADVSRDDIGHLAILASVAGATVLAEAVRKRVLQNRNHWDVREIVNSVPWDRLHPLIQGAVSETGLVPPERIDPARLSDLNTPPVDHCHGLGMHPALVARWSIFDKRIFRFWNPEVPAEDLRAWVYAIFLHGYSDDQDVQAMLALLDTLPPSRRARFEEVIAWRLGARADATRQSFLPA